MSEIVNVTLFNKHEEKIDEFTLRYGTNLWTFLRKKGWPVGAACSGVGVCAACFVTIREKPAPDARSAQTEFEQRSLLRNGKDPSCRLSCLYRVYTDIEVKADYW